MKIKKLTISYSVLSEYKRCPSAFRFRYLESLIRPPIASIEKGSPLTFGHFAHQFLELYHGGVPHGDALSAVLGEASQTPLGSVEPSGLRSLLHLELLLRAYVSRYPDPNAEFTPQIVDGKQALELEVDTLLTTEPQITWRQHLDGLVDTKDGPLVLEHKTSSGNLSTDLVERMLPNDQAVGYVYGVRKALGIPVRGLLFNGLCTYRPLVNPGYKSKAQNPQPLFYRRFVPIEDWQLDLWEVQTMRAIKRLIEDIEDGAFTQSAPDACTLFNSRCAFAELCKQPPSARQALSEMLYTKESWKGWDISYES